ncbi:substrate-binding domain-containing protein [Oceaniglobus roseus]|uniref:substrate-binding domain-containing protein n=1 Tax=Oceaniglobus roseus TaxID=1737570 RepID=UPI000C7EDC55|nr:substrate-binding domain-containing protein [Kandeliimicrobium roseum]
MLARTFAATAVALTLGGAGLAQDQSILVQSTTSTANSGLYDYLLPIFEGKTGIKVNVVAVGTGQAIKNAENCDGDLLLVHAKPAEEKFVADGYGTMRTDLMYNDFVVVGPEADPAGVAGMNDVEGALKKIAEAKAPFASRGDDSGTHKAEKALWKKAGVDPAEGSGDWYRETGSGMGATLNAGIGMGAYVLTDRATWISFDNKQDYRIEVEGDEDMFNQYGVIPVNPEKCPSVKAEAAQTFADWLLSDEGQEAIAGYKVDGQQLFFPNAPDK